VLGDPERVAAVERLIASGLPGGGVQRLANLAARLLGAPFAQVSLLAERDQVVAAAVGAAPGGVRRTPAKDSLCSVTVASGEPLVVADAAGHPWVRDLPPVTSGQVSAYLGVLLSDAAGYALGSLCVYDDVPHPWSDADVETLTALAEALSAELASDDAVDPTGVRLRLMADAADLGSYDLDLVTGVLVWDDRMLALHGVSRESFTGGLDDFRAVVHPEDMAVVQDAMDHAMVTLGDLMVEYRVVLAGGHHRWVKARGRVLGDMLGQPARIMGAAFDISAERGQREELNRVLETMPAAFVRVDREWTIGYVNAVAEGLYGRSRRQLVGMDLWEAFPEAVGSDFEVAYRRAHETGERGKLQAFFEPLDTHFDVHVWPDDDGLSFFFQDVNDSTRARMALEEAGARLGTLATAGVRLSATLRPREVLAVLADLVIPELAAWFVLAVDAEVADLLGVPHAGGRGRLYPVEVRHADPALAQDLQRLVDGLTFELTAESGVGRAVRTAEAQPFARVPDDVMVERAADAEQLGRMRLLNNGPTLTVPLRSASRTLGAFTVGASGDRSLDQVLLVDLGARAGQALDNALTFARQRRDVAALQTALLPREAPGVPDVLVATRYLPAAEDALAGGDFFKTVTVDGRLVTVLGDVMGHGTASAARAGQLHGLVTALALEGHSPGALLERLAAGVGQMMDLELATLVVCSYDPQTRGLTVASAGHPAPLVAPVTGQPAYLDVEPGPPLGVASARYRELTHDLEAGATMVLFSDGLVERRTESITAGLERLRVALNELRLPPEAVADHLLAVCGAEHGDDDVALLVLSHL
jgi:PAS domain-containing protein